MKKYLKLILAINLLLFFKLSVAQTDSLKNKNGFLITLNYGIPVYNKLSIYPDQEYGSFHNVNSKLKSSYSLLFTGTHNHYDFIIGLSYLQNEFEGNMFNMNGYNNLISPKKYILYQHIKYNVLNANLGFGYSIYFKAKHKLNLNLIFSIPAIYDITINNVYSKTGQTNDTTLFEATKNAKNDNTNFGRLPYVNVNLAYSYFFSKKIAINFNLSFIYAYSYGGKIPQDYKYETVFNNSNGYSYLAYRVHKQTILTPSIGFIYKIK